jgi:hypothetical protein
MIKNWNLFKESIDEKSKIIELCEKYGIENYTINDDLSIYVNGNVNLSYFKISNIPLKFGIVIGNFDCSDNKLTSLEGCPESVGGNFDCSYNKLKSLEGCPKWVGGDFRCSNNKMLKTLEFCPESVGRNFSCYNNKLKSLEFCPKSVGGNFICSYNKLTTLEFGPKWIGGFFKCDGNKIWSFKGIPDNFYKGIFCNENPIEHIWNLFKSSKDIEFFNDCHIIREPETPHGLPIVVLERLNYFLETIGKPTVEKVDGYINI